MDTDTVYLCLSMGGQEVVRLGSGTSSSRPGHHSVARYNSHCTICALGLMSLGPTSVFQFILETTSTRPYLRFLRKFVSEEIIDKI